jgi:hypothetical protein
MSLRAAASLLTVLAIAGCGSNAKKPSDADIAAYLAQSQPGYLHITNVTTSFEPAKSGGGTTVPDGSWVVKVNFNLHATQDLYGPVPQTRQERQNFDAAVMKFEEFRARRIAYVNQLGLRGGLMKQGDAAPEPAVAVTVVTHSGADLADSVTLLAQPDGTAWKFAQTGAQSLSDDQVGAPLKDLQASAPHTHFVQADTEEERQLHNVMLQFLAKLAEAPPP